MSIFIVRLNNNVIVILYLYDAHFEIANNIAVDQ